MDFTLVRNGMDYLSSAVLYLTGSIKVEADAGSLWPEATEMRTVWPAPGGWISDRYLKYGVLHLQAATEVLLKARLVREHWSLVFKEPGSAKRSDYEQGKFESCGTTAALHRLVHIVGIPISDAERAAITKLSETRNALTHYGHKANAYAVEARAADVLSFLVDFVPRHLQPALSKDAEQVGTTMGAVREKLWEIQALVKTRAKNLTSDLDQVAERTVNCPSCRQMALVVGESPVACRFCLRTFETPLDAAVAYWEDILDEDDSIGVEDCPVCKEHGVMRVATRAEPIVDAALCFHCGVLYTEKV
ncbi:hypothetical protein ABTX99_27880 [Streptomyces flaveolus]|uniref:hypothetical protein n=1 Tax=Streptomyces flaveolus TaxID=67297 RepID=UPI00332850F9